jgi:hypothetical protein
VLAARTGVLARDGGLTPRAADAQQFTVIPSRGRSPRVEESPREALGTAGAASTVVSGIETRLIHRLRFARGLIASL